MTWSHFSLEEDHYNNHFKLVKIDSFPVAADITNRGSLSQIWQTFFITNWDNYHYKSGPLLYLQIRTELLQIRTITNYYNLGKIYHKSG